MMQKKQLSDLEDEMFLNQEFSSLEPESEPDPDPMHPIDRDQSYWFQLRHDFRPNLMMAVSNPLFAMVMTIRRMQTAPADMPALYNQVVQEIKNIEVELKEAMQEGRPRYEANAIIAYTYMLCCHIDEAVMRRPWGVNSSWASQSLLVHFHQEAWGGEKVYALLAKLETEPDRYYDLLEFCWYCLFLGFGGKYSVGNEKRPEHQKVLERVNATLDTVRAARGMRTSEWSVSDCLSDPSDLVVARGVKSRRVPSAWWPVCIALVISVGSYYHYKTTLEAQTAIVMKALEELTPDIEKVVVPPPGFFASEPEDISMAHESLPIQ